MSGTALFLKILIPFALAAVLIVLILGVVNMARNTADASKWSNRLMRMRVLLQAVAVALIVAFIWANSRGGA